MQNHCFRHVVLLAVMLPAQAIWAEPVVEAAWLRAVPPVSKSTAGYLTLRNNGTESFCLTGVQAPFAAHTMLHSMAADDQGVRRMRHLDRLTVEPGEAVRFAPGGLHLMLTGLERVPEEGAEETLCLQFADRAPLCVPFAVKRGD